MVDSLDTMLLLGFKDDFRRAVAKVESLDFSMPRVSTGLLLFCKAGSFLV